MLTELQQVLSYELNCVAKLPQAYRNEQYQKHGMWVSYIFISIELNKYSDTSANEWPC